MDIRQAALTDLDTIKSISVTTISKIYPHYYPKGAVNFFLEHHREENILNDIEKGAVFLCFNEEKNVVETITIKDNEISRLFVLPVYQNKGFGTAMLDFAERTISKQYSKIVLAASLPAKQMYLKRGYRETEFGARYKA